MKVPLLAPSAMVRERVQHQLKNYTGEGVELVDISEACPFCTKDAGKCHYCEGTGKCKTCDGNGRTEAGAWEKSAQKSDNN